jgi:hypothetical protein
MKARPVALVLALATVVALALPAGATAKPGFYSTPGSTSEGFQLRGTHGYRLRLEVFNRRAQLSVEKQVSHAGLVSASYRLRRRLPPGPDIRFRLGKEGDFDLRFVPDHVVEHGYPGCTGGPEVAERGHFVGTIRFRGRHGFTVVDARRVNGLVARTPPHRCRHEKGPSGLVTVGIGAHTSPGVPEGALELIAGNADRKLELTGYRFEEQEAPALSLGTFAAWITRREPGFTLTSTAFGGSSAKSFVSPRPDKPLTAAKLLPSAPFSGSATFQMTSPRHGAWIGDLAVELPGYGTVPLTGPKFAAGLCETKACTPTLPKSLRP